MKNRIKWGGSFIFGVTQELFALDDNKAEILRMNLIQICLYISFDL